MQGRMKLSRQQVFCSEPSVQVSVQFLSNHVTSGKLPTFDSTRISIWTRGSSGGDPQLIMTGTGLVALSTGLPTDA